MQKREYTVPPSTLKSPVILFRKSGREFEDELFSAKKKFVTVSQRTAILPGSLVIGRYSVLPFYKELENDLAVNGSRLINTHEMHRFVADIQEWYPYLHDVTPKTWFRVQDVPDNIGPIVLKGETNSKKDLWKTHMFANNKREGIEVMHRLMQDSLFSNQRIYAREFITFANFGENEINGRPITDEHRVFVLDGKIMASGFYWTDAGDEIIQTAKGTTVPKEFLERVIEKLSEATFCPRFYVIDVARLPNGEWMVVELNDGQMSGLSECSPDELYSNMKYELWESKWSPQG